MVVLKLFNNYETLSNCNCNEVIEVIVFILLNFIILNLRGLK